MNTDQRHRIRDLFEAALERDEATAGAWLASEAADDPDWLPVQVEPGLVSIAAQSCRDERVVTDFRVRVQRQVVGGQLAGEVVLGVG